MKTYVSSLVCSLAFLAAACGGGDATTPAPSPAASPTASACPPSGDPEAPVCSRGRAFILVRHAEKDGTGKDPSLSERGHARAETLASMLATAGVTRLVATEYKRTQETLAPLGTRLSLEVEVAPAAKSAALAAELLAAPDGAVVVVATHSNVLPGLVKELGGGPLKGVSGDALAEDDFSRVVVVTDACGATTKSTIELGSGS